MAAIRIKRGTRAQLVAAAAANGLAAGEPYLITDEGLIAIGLTDSTYQVYEPSRTPASQIEMEAGTEAAIRSMSPLRVAQAVAALGGSVDVSGTPTAGKYSRWTDANTLEGRTEAQVRSDLGLSEVVLSVRPDFLTYVDSDTIRIGAGKAVVNGTLLSWAEQTKDLGPSGTAPMNAAQLVYLYLHNNSGTAAFVASTSAPTWDATHGYYKGTTTDYRLVGWVLIWYATSAATYRIVPFIGVLNNRELVVTYNPEVLSGGDQWTSTQARLGSTTSTSSAVSALSLSYAALIPAVCHGLFCGMILGGSVAGDNGQIGVGPNDLDNGQTNYPRNFLETAMRLTFGVDIVYLPHVWVNTNKSGSIYYAVNRIAGTGTVTGYVDCNGGKLFI